MSLFYNPFRKSLGQAQTCKVTVKNTSNKQKMCISTRSKFNSSLLFNKNIGYENPVKTQRNDSGFSAILRKKYLKHNLNLC